MNIDWSKAPIDATHAVGGRFVIWLKAGRGYWWEIVEPMREWHRYTGPVVELIDMVARPESWIGEGLPPVGLTCEFMWNYKREGSEYVKARIVAHDDGKAIIRVIDGEDKGALRESLGGDCGDHPIFRPIRTPEQIAEEHLFRRISALSALHRLPMSESGAEQLASSLVKDGYRKFEIVEGE